MICSIEQHIRKNNDAHTSQGYNNSFPRNIMLNHTEINAPVANDCIPKSTGELTISIIYYK